VTRRQATIAGLRAELEAARAAGRAVGFVPTMGYLHEGHLSLLRRARADCDVVVASVFVNPLQFGPGEDLATYPRDLDRDLALCAGVGVDVAFTPDTGEMYPEGRVRTTVTVAGLADRWEGASRPTHFAGVATVVAKLFAIVGPCRAYFGEKDFQQLRVVTQMAADLSLPVEVVGCPTVREPDGLALSSRNVYLSPAERAAAVVLARALDAGEAALARPGADGRRVERAMADVVAAEPLARLDYAAVVDPGTLEPAEQLTGDLRLLIAARVGATRLIDNRGVRAPSGGCPPPTSTGDRP
jgi:pantoate--beta-alanine ligase